MKEEMENIPKEIYLNIDPDSLNGIDALDFNEHEEISWSPSRIHETDLRYVPESELTALRSRVKELEEYAEYWKRRCKLSEKYSDESPCDPDITKEQIKAWRAYADFITEFKEPPPPTT